MERKNTFFQGFGGKIRSAETGSQQKLIPGNIFRIRYNFVSIATPAEPRDETIFIYCKFWAVKSF